jgi:hypothetical protein
MIEHIQANARITIEQLRSISGIDFGYNIESVEWLEGYIERLRLAGEFQNGAKKEKLISVLGSFLGECIVRCYGGSWVWAEQAGTWSVCFGKDNHAFPFAKVTKQIENGIEDSIGSFFRAIPVIFKGQAREIPIARSKKPWWRFW